jgi:fermentation-respiration switch protein FrsA (DUF1100 family)
VRGSSSKHWTMEFHEQITIGYIFFGFAFLVSLGFWQVLSTFLGLRAFSLLPRGIDARWGYLLGPAFMVLGAVWFFGTRTAEIFSPGPASSEFLFFLFLALLCTLLISIVVSSVLGGMSAARQAWKQNPGSAAEALTAGRWKGELYLPTSGDAPWPVVCLVPGPGAGNTSLARLGSELASRGVGALVMDTNREDMWQYPDVLAVIPEAVAHLERRADLDASRLGLVGTGLGADLAMRAAAADRQVGAVVALSPLLGSSGVQPGLDLLSEMTYVEAIRWRRAHKGGEVVSSLAAWKHISQLDSRPVLVIQGQRDRLAARVGKETLPLGAETKTVNGRGHLDLARDGEVLSSTVNWLLEHL